MGFVKRARRSLLTPTVPRADDGNVRLDRSKMPAHYIAQANREKLGMSGMDKVVAFDQNQSLDGFIPVAEANTAGTPGANKVVTLRSNFEKKRL